MKSPEQFSSNQEGTKEDILERKRLRRSIQRSVRRMATVCSMCWFLGVVVFAVVERMHTDITHHTDISPPYHAHSMLLASAGGLTYVTGVAGYWGSLHLEHGLVCGAKIKQKTMKFVKISVREDKDFFFDLQEQLQCCGSESPSDWVDSTWWKMKRSQKNSSQVVPHSCCRNIDQKDKRCQEGLAPYTQVTNPKLIYQQGCQSVVVNRRHVLLLSSGIVSCVCGVIKLVSFLSIHCFAKSIHANQRRVEELGQQPETDFTEVRKKAESHYRTRIGRLRDA